MGSHFEILGGRSAQHRVRGQELRTAQNKPSTQGRVTRSHPAGVSLQADGAFCLPGGVPTPPANTLYHGGPSLGREEDGSLTLFAPAGTLAGRVGPTGVREPKTRPRELRPSNPGTLAQGAASQQDKRKGFFSPVRGRLPCNQPHDRQIVWVCIQRQ